MVVVLEKSGRHSAGRIRVAIKVIEGVSGAVGGKEFRGLMVVKEVSHPNLCQISAFWLKDEEGRILSDLESEELRAGHISEAAAQTPFARANQLIIAMQLGDESLLDRLQTCQHEELGGIPVQDLLSYLEDASRAIDLLNVKYKIQHCDIKPQNILLLNGAPLVCDFGLARSLDDLRRSTTLTYSPAYGAPELYDGHESPTTDQYSLAVSYVELRTGRLPFENMIATAVMKAKVTGDLDLSALPEREREVIEQATSVNPSDRFASCCAMLKALRLAVESTPTRDDEIVPGYSLVREIGTGAYGTVWEARAHGGIPAAIKILEMDESAGRVEYRGLQEVKDINHPNLCPISGIWLKDEYGRILEQSEEAALAMDSGREPGSPPDSNAEPSMRKTSRPYHSDTDAEESHPRAATPGGVTLQPDPTRPSCTALGGTTSNLVPAEPQTKAGAVDCRDESGGEVADPAVGGGPGRGPVRDSTQGIARVLSRRSESNRPSELRAPQAARRREARQHAIGRELRAIVRLRFGATAWNDAARGTTTSPRKRRLAASCAHRSMRLPRSTPASRRRPPTCIRWLSVTANYAPDGPPSAAR